MDIEHRARRRVSLALFGSVANAVSSIMGFIVFIFSVRLTVGYLGEDRFGIWMTILSLSTLLTFLDFGIGNGLVSRIATIKATSIRDQLANTVTRGLLLVIGLGIFVLSAGLLFNHVFPIVEYFYLDTNKLYAETNRCIVIFIVLFSLSIPLRAFNKVLEGLQLSWIVHVANFFASLISLFLVFYLSKKESEIGVLLLATYGLQVIMPIVFVPLFLSKKLLTTTPHRCKADALLEYRVFWGNGGRFFLLQLGAIVGWGADSILIAGFYGAAAVAQFAIVQKIYQTVSIPIRMLSAPLWPAYADAKAHRDTKFIRKLFVISLVGSFVASIFGATLIYLNANYVMRIWTNDSIEPALGLLVAFSVWTIVEAVSSSVSIFLSGMGILNAQLISMMLFVSIAIPMKLYALNYLGVDMMVWGTTISYAIATLIFYSIYFRRKIIAAVPLFFS